MLTCTSTSQLPVVGDPSRDPRRARLRASRRPRPRRRRCGLPGPRGRVGAVAARGPGVRARGRRSSPRRRAGRVRCDQERCAAGAPLLERTTSSAARVFDTYLERGLLGLASTRSSRRRRTSTCTTRCARCPARGCARRRRTGWRGSRETGDVASPGSQVLLLDDIDSDAGNHNAGWLGFGPADGKLYVAVGDGGRTRRRRRTWGR